MSQISDNPPYRWRTVRVFISSTFRDFHAERDYLVKHVFPDLRQWCEKWKLHLVDIDLRWGVTRQDAESGKVIDICLEQIDGSRPFFICMLGNRYGWVPDKKDIPAETHKTYNLLKTKEQYSVTHLEIQHAVLEPLKSLDDLEEVPHAFFYFRDEQSTPRPEEIPEFTKVDREEYRKTFFESDALFSAKISALKSEITAHYDHLGKARNNPLEASERIFAYHPQFDPDLNNPEDDQLKGRFSRDSLHEFGERVKSDLLRSLSHHYADRIQWLSEQKSKDDDYDRLIHDQESFIQSRTLFFVGRERLLSQLTDFVESDATQMLIVTGEPGCGKTSLLAQFYQSYKYDAEGNELHEDTLFTPVFVGANPDSTNIFHVLKTVMAYWKKCYSIEGQIWSDPFELISVFKDYTQNVTGKAILLIDGLDLIDNAFNARLFFWLPYVLPPNVKWIVSVRKGPEDRVVLSKSPYVLTVPPFNEHECGKVVRTVPSFFSKNLNENQVRMILSKESSGNPLFLTIVLNELRVFGSYGKLDDRIGQFPSKLSEVFGNLLERLEQDYGKPVVEQMVSLIACARKGLTFEELHELMLETDKNEYTNVLLKELNPYLFTSGQYVRFMHAEIPAAIGRRYLSGNGSSHWHGFLAAYFSQQSFYLDNDETRPNRRKVEELPWHYLALENDWDLILNLLTNSYYIDASIKSGNFETVIDFMYEVIKVCPEAKQIRERVEAYRSWLRQTVTDLVDSSFLHSGHIKKDIGFFQSDTTSCDPADYSFVFPGMSPSMLKMFVMLAFLESHRGFFTKAATISGFDFTTFLSSHISDSDLKRESRQLLKSHIPSKPWFDIRGPKTEPANPAHCLSLNREIRQLLLSADGKILVARSDLRIKAWDTFTGRMLWQHDIIFGNASEERFVEEIENPSRQGNNFNAGNWGYFRNMCMTPDGKFVFIGTTSGHLLHYDITIGSLVGAHPAAKREIDRISCSPDGTLVALLIPTGADISYHSMKYKNNDEIEHKDSTSVCIVNIVGDTASRNASFHSEHSIEQYAGCIVSNSMQLFPEDGKVSFVISRKSETGSFTHYHVLLDIMDSDVEEFKMHDGPGIKLIQYNQHRDHALLYDNEDSIWVWNIQNHQVLYSTKFAKTKDETVQRLWIDPSANTCYLFLDKGLVCHKQGIGFLPGIQFKHSVDNASGISVNYDGSQIIVQREFEDEIQVYSVAKLLETMDNRSTTSDCYELRPAKCSAIDWKRKTAFIPARANGNYREDRICLYSTDTGKIVDCLDIGESISSLHFSPFGNKLLTSGYITEGKKGVRIWNLDDKKYVDIGTGHSYSTEWLYCTPDEARVISAEGVNFCEKGNKLLIYDAATGASLQNPMVKTAIKSMTVSSDGRLAYWGNEDGTIGIWDIEKEMCLGNGMNNGLDRMLFTPDGRSMFAIHSPIVYGGGFGFGMSMSLGESSICLWDLSRMALVNRVTQRGEFYCNKGIISPDGRKVYYESYAYPHVHIYDLRTHSYEGRMVGHAKKIRDMHVTSDGKHVITSSEDFTLRLWDASDGHLISMYHASDKKSLLSICEPASMFCTALGKVGDFLHLSIENLAAGPAILTSSRLWKYGPHGVAGKWDTDVTMKCPLCLERFPVSNQLADVISSINRSCHIGPYDSPCLKLPDEAWDEPKLLFDCPKCGGKLKSNPFVVDNKDRFK
jgi:WD40 repeat protein